MEDNAPTVRTPGIFYIKKGSDVASMESMGCTVGVIDESKTRLHTVGPLLSLSGPGWATVSSLGLAGAVPDAQSCASPSGWLERPFAS